MTTSIIVGLDQSCEKALNSNFHNYQFFLQSLSPHCHSPADKKWVKSSYNIPQLSKYIRAVHYLGKTLSMQKLLRKIALQFKSNIFSYDSYQIIHHFISFISGTDTKCTDLCKIQSINVGTGIFNFNYPSLQ